MHKSQIPAGIFVGSTNPVKVGAVTRAVRAKWPDIQIVAIEVDSKIPAQPVGDFQTRAGAQNRAQQVLKAGLAQISEKAGQKLYLGVGLEGGVVEFEGQLWSTVWGCVVDNSSDQDQANPRFFENNGARFILPAPIAMALRQGAELGPLMSQLYDGADIKRTSGAIGIITDGFVDRTEEYSAIIKLAIGLWYGRKIHPQLAYRAKNL